jgi:hypothetical protein
MSLPNDPLALLIDAVRENGPYVFASPEDAEFFRKGFKAPPPEPVVPPTPPPKPAPIAAVPKPMPIAPAAPVVKELPPEPKMPLDLNGVRRVLSVVAPELRLIDEIPDDLLARKISERWKTKNQGAPISILTFQEPPEQMAFLTEIAKALDIYFGPAKIIQAEAIEKGKEWESFLSVAELKTIIVCDYTLWQMSSLMQFYKETPATGARLLGTTPLFLLPNLSLYLKDSQLKRSLWKALCQKFS